MADGIELGTAYLNIAVATKDLGRDLRKAFGSAGREGDNAGEAAGKGFAGGLKNALGAGAIAGIAASATAALAGGIADAAKGAFSGVFDQANMTAGLNAAFSESPKVAAKAGRLTKDLWKNNFGETVDDTASIVSAVQTTLSDVANGTDADFKKISGNLMSVSTATGIEAETLINTIGVSVKSGMFKTSEEALDVFTSAAQKMPAAMREELIPASDEYGQFFTALGFNGKEAFGALAEASKNGVFGIDKTGDALKEFTIRATDMSKSSTDALKSIGLDSSKVANDILAGGDTAKTAFNQVASSILKIKDPAERSNTAIALFGTQMEDLGVGNVDEVLTSFTTMGSTMGDVQGSATRVNDALNNTPAAKWESFKRGLQQFATDTLSTKLLPALTTGTDSLNAFGAAFSSGKADPNASGVVGFASTAGKALKDLWTNVKPDLESLWGEMKNGATTVKEVAEQVWPKLQSAFQTAKPVLTDIGAALKSTLGYLKDNKDIIVVAAGYIATMNVAMKATAAINAAGSLKAYVTGLAAMRKATLLATIEQLKLNFAMLANPVGIIIAAVLTLGAVFYLLWTKCDGFREAMTGAWDAIKGAVSAVGTWFTDTLWPGMKGVFESLGGAARDLWQKHMKPAWDSVLGAAKGVGAWFTDTLWPGMKGVFESIGGAATWLWQSVMKPAFDGIAAVVTWWWNTIVTPVFNAYKFYITGVIWPIMQWLWNSVFKPVFEGIGTVVKVTWESVIKPAFNALKTFVTQTIPNAFTTMKDAVVTAWTTVRDGINTAWVWVRDNILNPVVTFVKDRLVNAFNFYKDAAITAWTTVRDGINTAWVWVRDNILSPVVTFVQERLVNAFNFYKTAAINAWNAVRDGVNTVWVWVRDNILSPVNTYFTVTVPNAAGKLKDGVVNAWNGMKDGLSAGWNWLKTNVFDKLVTFVKQTIPQAFTDAKNGINDIWQKVQGIVEVPVRFVVNDVIGGLVRGINAILNFVGAGSITAPSYSSGGSLPGAQVFNTRSGGRGHQLAFASGGIVPGPRSVGRDNQVYINPRSGHRINLASDEGVLHQYGVDALGGTGAFERFNAIARDRGPQAGRAYLDSLMHGGYASGGLFAKNGLGHAHGDWVPDWLKTTGGAVKQGWDWSYDKGAAAAAATWEGAKWLGNQAVSAGSALYGFAKDSAEALANPASILGKIVGSVFNSGALNASAGYRDMLLDVPKKPIVEAGKFITGKRDAKSAEAKKKAEAEAPGVTGPLPPSQGGQPSGFRDIAARGKSAFPGISVTSTYRPGARVNGGGIQSFHSLGRAVDFAAPMNAAGKALMAQVFHWWDKNYQPSELLHSPMGNNQLNRGHRRGGTSGNTNKIHWNHVHVAFSDGGSLSGIGKKLAATAPPMSIYDNGGWLQPGEAALNLSARPEPIFNASQWGVLEANLRTADTAIDYDRMGRAVATALANRRLGDVHINNYGPMSNIDALDKAARDDRYAWSGGLS